MSLFVSINRESVRENFAQAVERRLTEREMTLAGLSKQTGLSEEKLTGQDEMFLPELRAVTQILWEKEPSEVSELWPFVGSQAMAARAFVMLAEHQAPV